MQYLLKRNYAKLKGTRKNWNSKFPNHLQKTLQPEPEQAFTSPLQNIITKAYKSV